MRPKPPALKAGAEAEQRLPAGDIAIRTAVRKKKNRHTKRSSDGGPGQAGEGDRRTRPPRPTPAGFATGGSVRRSRRDGVAAARRQEGDHLKASQASGRHRRDGRRPSGNSRGRSVKRDRRGESIPSSPARASSTGRPEQRAAAAVQGEGSSPVESLHRRDHSGGQEGQPPRRGYRAAGDSQRADHRARAEEDDQRYIEADHVQFIATSAAPAASIASRPRPATRQAKTLS